MTARVVTRAIDGHSEGNAGTRPACGFESRRCLWQPFLVVSSSFPGCGRDEPAPNLYNLKIKRRRVSTRGDVGRMVSPLGVTKIYRCLSTPGKALIVLTRSGHQTNDITTKGRQARGDKIGRTITNYVSSQRMGHQVCCNIRAVPAHSGSSARRQQLNSDRFARNPGAVAAI